MNIRIAQTDLEIAASFSVMQELRPQLTQDTYVARIRRQEQGGYRLVIVEHDGKTVAAAGFRIGENLAWGRFLYVDDLVTDEERRSRGFGKALLQWLVAEAKRHGCRELHLDSGTQRKDAHRFYEREGMDMVAYHYVISV